MSDQESVRVTLSMPRGLASKVERFWHDRHLGSFSEAVRMLIETSLPPADPARYFAADEPLVDRASRGQYRVPGVPLLYLRLVPSEPIEKLKLADAYDLIRQGPLHLEPFYYTPTGTSFEPNEFGAIAFSGDYNRNLILSAAQLFQNGEIWAFNATLLDPDSPRKLGVPTGSVEQTFAVTLPKYVKFLRTKLAVQGPIHLEAGASAVKGYVLHMPTNFMETQWGPIQQRNFRWTGSLEADDPASIDQVLLSIFEAFFDAAGVRRPKGLYHFPGATPGAIPRS